MVNGEWEPLPTAIDMGVGTASVVGDFEISFLS